MSRADVEKLIPQFRNIALRGSVSDAEIDAREAALGIRIPKDFRTFLSVYGAGQAGPEDYLGASLRRGDDAFMTRQDLLTPSTHAPFPERLLPVNGNGYGDYYCIDLAESGIDSSVIVFWQHDNFVDPPEFIANGYWSWLANSMSEALQYDLEG